MTEKRFTYRFNKEDDGEFEIIDFDDDAYYGMDTTENCVRELVKLLNELHEENQALKKHIRELYRVVKIDVDNEIEVYPKVMLEYLINILKIIGDVE